MAITSTLARARASGAVTCLVLVQLATGALGAGASTASGGPPAAAPDGRASVPAPGQESVLYAVSCTSSANCWAVGRYKNLNGALVDQALHWNGRAWSLVTTPGAGGSNTKALGALFGVTCTLPASCWAVGERGMPDGSEHDQVLHWNGRRWSLVAAPDPGAATGGGSELSGVRCTPSANCWAVGSSRKSSTAPSLNLILHWNGRRWSLVSAPNPGGAATGHISELGGVRCTSSASCWAVGDYGTSSSTGGTDLNQALHWNGRKWSLVATPDPGGTGSGDFSLLNTVSCPSTGSCWAVGAYGSRGIMSTSLNQVLHWNGRKWSLVATPDPDGTGAGANNLLFDLACTSSVSCWGVGGYGTTLGHGVQLNQALHWNGRKWSLVATPDPGGTAIGDSNFLSGVRCTSAASCWAVGDSQPAGGADVNQALRWNGSRWSAR
jgi:hypothetical protein